MARFAYAAILSLTLFFETSCPQLATAQAPNRPGCTLISDNCVSNNTCTYGRNSYEYDCEGVFTFSSGPCCLGPISEASLSNETLNKYDAACHPEELQGLAPKGGEGPAFAPFREKQVLRFAQDKSY